MNELLSRIRIVLVATTHPGNIGATARAMKTMGLSDLRLVAPKIYPDAAATARASGANDILQNAVVCETLEEALTDAVLVCGASARLRSLSWPVLPPRASAEKAVQMAQNSPVAFVFGRESSGLNNDELERCHYLLNIPANPDYSSLNLAAAVQVVVYELRTAALAAVEATNMNDAAVTPLASSDDMERFYAHLEQTMLNTGFLNPDNPRQLMRRLRRLFNRAQPDQNEINILRGILGSVKRLE